MLKNSINLTPIGMEVQAFADFLDEKGFDLYIFKPELFTVRKINSNENVADFNRPEVEDFSPEELFGRIDK